MMSLKVLLVACCLVAAVQCTLPIGGILGGPSNGGETDLLGGGNKKGFFLGGLVGSIFKSLSRIATVGEGVLQDILNLRVPQSLDDVFNLFRSVGLGIGDILNKFLPGFGTFLSRIISGVVRILICILGSPGLSGTIFNDRTPGRFNPPLTCGNLDRYKVRTGGDYDWISIFKEVKLYGIHNEIEPFVRKCRQKPNLPVSINVILNALTNFAAQFKDNRYSKQKFTKSMSYLVIITGVVTENRNNGQGVEIVVKISSSCDKVLKQYGYPLLTDEVVYMKTEVSKCQNDKTPWSPTAPTTDDTPATDAPVTNEPVTNKPVTKKPVTKKPVTKKPKVTEPPVTDAPDTDQPDTDQPDTDAPDTYASTPETGSPNTKHGCDDDM